MALLVLLTVSSTRAALQPNILLVVADDLGWGDAPWLDPSLPAPNIRQLARTGIVLNNSYVQQASCNKMILRLMVNYTGVHAVPRGAADRGVPLPAGQAAPLSSRSGPAASPPSQSHPATVWRL